MTQLSKGNTATTLFLIREDAEKLYNHHTEINTLKLMVFH